MNTNQEPVLRPIRYEDVSAAFGRRAFNRNFYRIVGDIYLHRSCADDPLRITEALLKRRPDAVLRGFAALDRWGFQLLYDTWEPILSIPSNNPAIVTTRGHFLRRTPVPTTILNGTHVVSPTQAVHDIFTMPNSMPNSMSSWTTSHSLISEQEEHIALLDHLTRQSLDILHELKGDATMQPTVALVNPLAESRPESIVRVRLTENGVGNFRPQVRVRGLDGHYYVDLGDPLLRVGIEYQGAHHFDRHDRARDAARMNDLRWAGWRILEATSTILTDDYAWAQFLDRVHQALQESRRERMNRLPTQLTFPALTELRQAS